MEWRARAISALILTLLATTSWAQTEGGGESETLLQSETFNGLELRSLGPALMSGRVADLAIHPKRRSTWYVAVGSGGVWKTENAGTTWTPIFDGESSYSIGCVTIDPNHPEIVWVGTGENVGGRHVGYGDGVYRSLDGGKSWENMGLKQSEHLSRILVDPRDSDVVYVASQGPLWSAGGERGLFKTTDGGKTWTNVLSAGEYTGVTDVVMDPRDADVLYAATHQRYRNVAALVNGGPETGIHKSTDGGVTWRRLENGLPAEDMGKIGLAVSPINPDIVYAAIELAHREGGFYRSTDAGGSWEKRSDYVSGGTGPHYYQEIYASPHKLDRVYQANVWIGVTEDGGKTFGTLNEDNKHSDTHAIAFLADDPDYLLIGCDGGIYESFDLGQTFKFAANLPVTQFYKVAVDDDVPFYNVYGGTQDNATQGGPSRTENMNGIRNSDWFITVFGDGHQPAVEPGNPDIIYSEWQQGNLVRHDRKTGEIVYIQPQPAADELHERFNWDAPILVSPHDAQRIYYASQRVWTSPDRGDSWEPISGDLTRDIDRLKEPMMGRVQSFDAMWDLWAMSEYSTITSLAQSPIDTGVLYVGTDDGLIQVTEDGGGTWRRIDALPGVPEMFFVNDVKADLFDPDTVYVCVDNHKAGDFKPYVLKSTDRGNTWTSIAGDLPDRHLVWRLVQDHRKKDLLFLGTEMGVFFTVDGGTRWVELNGGVPTIPFRDLAIQRRENDLVGATFGRGFYVLDDYSPLRSISEDALSKDLVLFDVRDAHWYVERRPLGMDGKASQGDAFYVADNPPFGAVFTYYLKDGLQKMGDARRDREKEIAKEGGDTPYPGWDGILAEEREEEPRIVLSVTDSNGALVRRVFGPVTAGFHRVAWDLRYPAVDPWRPSDEEVSFFEDAGGYLAAPGTYTVTIAREVNGRLEESEESQTFEVRRLREGTLPSATPGQVGDFMKHLGAVRRAVRGASAAIDEALVRARAIEATVARAAADMTLRDEARAIETRLLDLQLRLNGSETRDMVNDLGPVSISRRLGVATTGNRFSTYGPTETHKDSLLIAMKGVTALKKDLDEVVGTSLPALEAKLDAAGVPWTPGRSAPPLSGR